MLVVGTLLPSAALAQARPAARKVRVAVLELRSLGAEAEKAALLSEVALTEAARFRDVETIGRSDVATMLGFERQKQLLGCAEDAACLVEIAGALGAEYLLVGSLGRLGASWRLDMSLVDQKKARVLGRVGESVTGEEDRLVGVVQQAVRQLLGLLPGAGPQRPAATPAAPAARFDGLWDATVDCPDHNQGTAAKGYVLKFQVTVAGGALTGSRGVEGTPGHLRLQGTVNPDGSAELFASGLTTSPDYSLGRQHEGTRYAYRATGQFEGASGQALRTEGRTCQLRFVRRP
jgi:TolB-like protein